MTQSETLELSLQLLRQPSVTPVDHTCQDIMAKRLEKIGFNIENMRFDDVDNPIDHRCNRGDHHCYRDARFMF